MSDLPDPLWIFGYGSLVWRPAFAHEERVPAVLSGWMRRFWQGSPDHRGTPDAPGRVVTLLPAAGQRVTGMAYRVSQAAAPAILAALDHREKAGYARHVVDIDAGGTLLRALVYVATADNPDFLGPEPITDMASHIARSHGPSGANVSYLLRLHQALVALGAEDPHVRDLVAALPRR